MCGGRRTVWWWMKNFRCIFYAFTYVCSICSCDCIQHQYVYGVICMYARLALPANPLSQTSSQYQEWRTGSNTRIRDSNKVWYNNIHLILILVCYKNLRKTGFKKFIFSACRQGNISSRIKYFILLNLTSFFSSLIFIVTGWFVVLSWNIVTVGTFCFSNVLHTTNNNQSIWSRHRQDKAFSPRTRGKILIALKC